MKNTVLIIAKGSKHIDLLIKNREFIRDNLNIVIYTDQIEVLDYYFKSADIRKYDEPIFRYFDKYKLTYDLVQEKKQPVMYIDISKLKSIFRTDLTYFDKNKISHIYTNGNWNSLPNASRLRFFYTKPPKKGYLDNILDYFEKENISLDKINPIIEKTFVFPFKDFMSDVMTVLESIRPLFEWNSKNKEHFYTGIGNGEGLALGYALAKCKVTNLRLSQMPINKLKAL